MNDDVDFRNGRHAGRKRVNAMFERLRVKPCIEELWLDPDDGNDARELLVMLLSRKFLGDAAMVEEAFRHDDSAVFDSVDGIVRVGSWEFGLRWRDGAFGSESMRRREPDVRLAVARHVGWLSVMLIAAPRSATEKERAARVAQAAARLAGETASVVHYPLTGATRLCTEPVRAALEEGRVDDAFVG